MQRQHDRARRRIAEILLLFLLAVPELAFAELREVAPGEQVRLSEDAGLLLVAVDTDTPLQTVRIKRNGTLFDAESLKGVSKGRTTRLYVATAGTYRWDSVRDAETRYKIGDDDEYFFKVEPGALNYPGDLVYRPIDRFNVMVHVANRGLLAMDWLTERYADVSQRYEFRYMGHYPDPFPAFYHDQVDAAVAGRASSPQAADTRLPISVDQLWKPSDPELISINPAGDLVATVNKERRGGDTVWALRMTDLTNEHSVLVLKSEVEVSRIDWSGSRAVVISCSEAGSLDQLFILQVVDEGAQRRYERLHVPMKGLLVDVLPREPNYILFASVYLDASGFGMQVHRLDISTQRELDRFRFSRSTALDRGVGNDWAWYADAKGQLRAAIAYKEDSLVLMHGGYGKYREVMSLDDSEAFSPLALSADGNLLYGWTEKDREQRDLVELDPGTGKIGRTLFSLPGVDVQDALFDGKRNLIGATYYEDGLLVSEYFDAASKRLQAQLQQAFPGKTVRILDRDSASEQFLLVVGSSDQPSDIYHFDAGARRASLLQHTRPWLSGHAFVPSHVVRAASRDGFPIEAYLTLPKTAQRLAPLVVLSHGGPIGVRDVRYFDPEVQFLASLGYAVLQVNFRGSEGYGRQFREAGKRSYGTLIEDDVDAALAATLAAHPVDPERMCTMGSSYGGYSALVSAIRWPTRFRCVVSISGVSDRILFFTASDSGRSKEGREMLEDAIGDPHADAASMRTHSPLYRFRELTTPVMLAHGTDDFRVDYEHTRRMVRMLEGAGRPPALITLEGEGHSVEGEANRRKLWEGVAAFLRMHLGAGVLAEAR